MFGIRTVLLALGAVAVMTPAFAQQTPVGVFCIHQRIQVERLTPAQASRGRDPRDACMIGPTFELTWDATNWVRQNMRVDVGSSCSCR